MRAPGWIDWSTLNSWDDIQWCNWSLPLYPQFTDTVVQLQDCDSWLCRITNCLLQPVWALPSKRSKLPNITYCRNSIKTHRHDQTQEAVLCTAVHWQPVCFLSGNKTAQKVFVEPAATFIYKNRNSSLKQQQIKGFSVTAKDERKCLLFFTCVFATG